MKLKLTKNVGKRKNKSKKNNNNKVMIIKN